MADEPKKMTEDQLRSLVDSEFENALGAGDLAEQRAELWRYYMSELRGDEVEGESQVVTSDVADVVDGIMPSLLRIFTIAENLLTFEPVGVEDIAAAEQESDYVNYVFFKQNPAFMILYTWFFDALAQKNGITKAVWEEYEEPSTERYEGLDEDEFLALMDDPDLEPVEREEYEGETVDPQTGEIVIATLHDVKFRRINRYGKSCVYNVPPEEYRISKDATSIDPSSARMVGQERDITRSEILGMGFDADIVNELPANGEAVRKPETAARQGTSSEESSTDVRDTRDKSQDKIRLREAYIKVDFDGDGRAELMQVFTAGDKLLSFEEADRQPFHVLSPKPLPHKHFGQASAEKAMDIQDVSTTLVRQALTNLYHVNKPGHAIWEHAIGENTLDDLLTVRVGGFKRFSRPPQESYMPLTVPFTASQSFQALEWFDKIKRDRTGIGSDSEGLSPEALKNIQQTVLASAIDIHKMKVEEIARIFAETGLKSLFLHLHELCQKHQDKPKIVRLRNKFVSVDPQAWRNRYDMTVNIGLGIGTREQNLLHLEAISRKQKEMLELGWGNLTVTPQNLYRTAAEFVKNANLKEPSMFFTDPGTKMAPPPNPEQLRLQQQEQQLIGNQQRLDGERQALAAQKQELARMEFQLDRQEIMLEHQREIAEINRKREADMNDLSIENEKLRNQLTEMELKYNSANVPGSKV